MHMNFKLFCLFIGLTVLSVTTRAQSEPSSDELFQQARRAAFDQKDYTRAINLCKKALAKSPDYSDIRVFLGRIYTWSGKTDSARAEFVQVLTKHPDNEDGAFAFGSLEFWNDNSTMSLQIVNAGLKYHPQSKDLLLLKAKVLNDLKRYSEANNTLDSLLEIDPANTGAHSLAERVQDNASVNKIGLTYDYIHFDKQYANPWQLASLEYGRQTGIGSFIGFVNYANRFNTSGVQYEIDAYPHISKIFYAYVSGGYSNDLSLFPQSRAGFSLYANLPASFEADAGFRYLHFSSNTWIYTASLGKYYRSFWFNFRTYLTPSNNSLSQSYSLHIRYYTGGADDYLSLGAGTGLSPDAPNNVVISNNGNIYKFKTDNISAAYWHSFKRRNVFFITASYDHQEYPNSLWVNDFDMGIGYLRRF
ncbi:MAG: YaiO family outer membrane beta-barrel protein [Bacteroidetes bacterium]|nr:YaiO family outer membrane beta-barrel protein [Bacteroidota bacterium]